MSENQSMKKSSSKFSRSMNRLEQFAATTKHSSNQIMNSSSSTTTLNYEFDFDTLVTKETSRKLFSKFLKEFNKSLDNLLTVYLIMSCFQNKNYIEQDSERIKQILERTYNACFVKNELTHLSRELKAKLGESLQNKIYDESIFNAVKKELRNLLENEYFPMFLQSKLFKENLSKKLITNNANCRNADTVSLNEDYATINDIYEEDCDTNEFENNNGTAVREQGYSVTNVDDEKRCVIQNGTKQSKIPSGIFAMPNVPVLKNTKQTSSNVKMLKQSKSSSSSTSSVQSVNSMSKRATSSGRSNEPFSSGIKNSHSKLSLTKELSSSRQKINNFPPNPYHVITKPIPVSMQDSEIQSTVSADFPSEIDHASLRYSRNLNEMSSLSCSKNSLNQQNSRLPRLNKDIKANLMANKDVEINMPEFKQELSAQPLKKPNESDKKPMSESDPLGFFNMLSAKLENLAINDENDYASIHSTGYNPNEMPEIILREKLSIPIESDLDSHIDEHINRVYHNDSTLNNGDTNKSQLLNSMINNSTFYDNSKMFKVSSLHKSLNLTKLNQTEQEYNSNETMHEQVSSFYHNNSNISNLPKPLKLNTSLSASHTRNLNKVTNKNKEIDENQHHFYKLTSTSKEVDIDHHTEDLNIMNKKENTFNEGSSNFLKRSSRNDSANKSAISNFKTSKSTKNHHHHHQHQPNDMNYDSGVSIRSAASIERVNDWLSNSGYQPNNENTTISNNNIIKNNKKITEKTKPLIESCGHKTTVAYYLPGEEVAYISTFNGKNLTLSQFKQLITKKGQFRYFFKTKSDLLDDEECVVFQEATDENACVPMFNNKVIAKIEKYNQN